MSMFIQPFAVLSQYSIMYLFRVVKKLYTYSIYILFVLLFPVPITSLADM